MPESEVVVTPQDLEGLVRTAVGSAAPGTAVVIVGPEGVRARAAVGMADLASDEPMTTHHSMPWFSMTKIATATAVMRLAERHLLDLDAPVRPMPPAMAALRPTDASARITARHLLQ